jgi:hypothetical protein
VIGPRSGSDSAKLDQVAYRTILMVRGHEELEAEATVASDVE